MVAIISQMQWPFAMVCIAFLVLCGVLYVTRRTVDVASLAEERRKLESENYRLTHLKD